MKNIYMFCLLIIGLTCTRYSLAMQTVAAQDVPCAALLDPRVDWQAINRAGALPEGPIGVLRPLDHKSTARQGGTWMVDEAGVKWMVKPDNYHQELTASNEVISSLIYSHFGILTPKTAKVWIDGKAYAAVRFLGRGLDESLLLYMHTSKWRSMRYAAAFLADWDRIHTGPNNFVIGMNEFISYDLGGTLGARASGRHKPGTPFSNAIGTYSSGKSFESMFKGFRLTDPTDPQRLNPDTPDVPLPAWHPWSQLNKEDALRALNGFESLTPELIEIYVKFAKYSDPRDESYMIQTLIDNRNEFVAGLKRVLADRPLRPAAGVVVYRKAPDSGLIEVLIRKVRGGFGGYDWSFAKGRIDRGENPKQAAVREVREELGAETTIEGFLIQAQGDVTYTDFFYGKAVSEVDLSFSSSETEAIRWADLETAMSLFNKPRDQQVLSKLEQVVK